MSVKAKASIFSIILLVVLSLLTAGFYFLSYETEKKLRVGLEDKVKVTEEARRIAESNLEKVTKEKISIEERLKKNEVAVKDLEDKLVQAKKENESLTQKQNDLELQIPLLISEKEKIEKSMKEQRGELIKIKKKLESLHTEKKGLEKKVLKLSIGKADNKEELGRIVVTPGANTPAEQKKKKELLLAQVLLINREYKFLVINAGQDKAVELGDMFEILQDDMPIGTCKVEKVHETMSATSFIEGFEDSQAKEGDAAKRIN